MLKYANIKGYVGNGELPFLSHLYQWRENLAMGKVNNPTCNLKKVIFIRAYTTSPFQYWVGYLVLSSGIYLNLPKEEIDLEEVCHVLGEHGKRIDDLEKFLHGTGIYEAVHCPKRVETWDDMENVINENTRGENIKKTKEVE